MEIKHQLVSSRSSTYGGENPCNYITIHETANYNKGAGAQAHANLQTNGFSASWHYQVDDKEVIQSFEDNVQCLHAGDKRGTGNLESIAIEICVNPDSDFKRAVEKTAELVKYLMVKHNISINNVVQHNRWSGKDCPHNLRDGSKSVTWNALINMVQSVKKEEVKPSNITVEENYAASANPVVSKTDSIVDWMNVNKMDSSYANRAKLAEQHGIKGYNGSTTQNTELLNKLRNGASKSKPKIILPSGLIRQGARGVNVRKIQSALASINFYPEKGAKNNGVDGIWGQKTTAALKRFQSIHVPGRVDGVYGPNTKKALEKLIKGKARS